mgnify:CR=1 FL=1
MIMQKEKLKGYESPTTELIVLQIENGILVVSGGLITPFTDDSESLDF